MKKLKNILKGIGIITFIGLALTAGFLLLKETTKIKVTSAEVVEKVKEVTVDNSSKILAEKIEKLENKVLEDLQGCESPNYTEDDALVTWDDNSRGTLPRKDKMSYGLYQFKISTVQHYAKTLRGEELTNLEAVHLALSENEAKELAREILFEKGSSDWYHCNRKLNLEARINIINELR